MSTSGKTQIELGGRLVASGTHTIVVAADAAPAERHAARELRFHLERISGQRIDVVGASGSSKPFRIVVGKHPLVRELGVDMDCEALGSEGVRIRTVGPHLVLTGNPRGTLYAVYVFLEEHLGCRWFTADCVTWPMDGRIRVGDLDIAYVPPLEYRASCSYGLLAPTFAARNRLNGPFGEAPRSAAWGGCREQYGGGHTFGLLVPPAEYFKSHPEYFSEINGNRCATRTQLCLTNRDVLRLVTRKVRRILRENPGLDMIWVSQNDHENYCTCPDCAALAEREGSQSGPVLHFVNAVADAVAREFPDASLATLAYRYTRKPPRHARPRPNVIVYLCSIECEFNRPLETAPFNRAFADDLRGWSRICSRLYVWDYVYNNRHFLQPFPDLEVLQPNIRFFVRHNVKGVLEQGNYFSRGGELAELRTFLAAKLMWDPEYDVGRGIEEFLQAYYGDAAPFIRSYLDDVHRRAVSDPGFHMTIGSRPGAPFQAPAALARYGGLFERAEKSVRDDPVRRHRVRVARLPVLYSRIAEKTEPLYRLTKTALVPAGGETDIRPEREAFEATARREGITAVEGDRGPDSMNAWLRKKARGRRRLPVVRIGNERLKAVIVPGLGGRLLRLSCDRRRLLVVTRRGSVLDPVLDGYKEFSEAGFGSPGFDDPFDVMDRSPAHILLYADLPNGLALRREYRVLEDQPVLRIASSVINIGGDRREICLRVHPCFEVKNMEQAELRLGPSGAPCKPLNVGNDGRTASGDYWLSDAERGRGEWALVDPAAGRVLVSRFDPRQIGKAYLDWSGAQNRVNLELFAAPHEVEPLEELTVHLEYEVAAL